ncbi:MAG TPA: DUF6456 domain-containing protein [Allosphingosinicella sp.]|jgi:hypothetical protein
MKAKRNRLLVERPLVDTSEPARPRDGQRARTRTARSVTVNLAESPLGWLKSRGHVTPRQYEAGDRLREEWERAQYAPGVTMRWDASGMGGGGAPEAMNASEAHVAARRRFEAAVEAVGGGLSDVLWRVVCAGEGMREVERALGWPARAGKLVLTLALDRLADHYRIR